MIRSFSKGSLLLSICILMMLQVTNGQSTDAERNQQRLLDLIADSTGMSSALENSVGDEELDIRPEAPCDCQLDSATYQAYLSSLQRYYKYRIHGFEHRQKVFEWQHVSTKIIFIVVIVLVLAGIYFAAVQFHHGIKHRKPGDSEEVTEFVASYKSVKVKSPVLGVIILVISLVFFYLYLVYVYPIVNVF